jgi:hypothetical protein
MDENLDDPCICGHLYLAHGITSGGWCYTCSHYKLGACGVFILDNLALVEQVARARGLV